MRETQQTLAGGVDEWITLLKAAILFCGLVCSQRMLSGLFNQIAPGLLLLGPGDGKGMPLRLPANEPFSLRSLLWLFKYTCVEFSKPFGKVIIESPTYPNT